MRFLMVGCSHINSPIEIRQRLAFNPEQASEAMARLRERFPDSETVLLSTCNRVECYAAAELPSACPTPDDLRAFISEFHEVEVAQASANLHSLEDAEAIDHLFTVAASLDSMVVGESQILAQVKKAYELADNGDHAGPIMHSAFQRAIRTAKRIANETALHEHRVSIPSIAVTDFAGAIYERFDDKRILVLGAGEMGEETLLYLIHQGARDLVLLNRSRQRAEQLSEKYRGRVADWDKMIDELIKADMVVGATSSREPILTLDQYRKTEHRRGRRPIFFLDLAVPCNFDPAIGKRPEVYLYTLDDLQEVCDTNRTERAREFPKARLIIQAETESFAADMLHRVTAPTIRQLRKQAAEIRDDELSRLINKLDTPDEHTQNEISKSFDRLVNKLLHPPLESLREEANRGGPHGLLEALKRLFQLKD